MKAFLKNYRQAPRKVRLVADHMRGKSVEKVLADLRFMPKRATGPLEKLLRSAVANARNQGSTTPESRLYVETITVDKGLTYRRYMPRARGRATPIGKETSHVRLALGARAEKKKTPKAEKTEKGVEKEADTKKEPAPAAA